MMIDDILLLESSLLDIQSVSVEDIRFGMAIPVENLVRDVDTVVSPELHIFIMSVVVESLKTLRIFALDMNFTFGHQKTHLIVEKDLK
jgi:hypothetical protein